jgi:hypothetical protein
MARSGAAADSSASSSECPLLFALFSGPPFSATAVTFAVGASAARSLFFKTASYKRKNVRFNRIESRMKNGETYVERRPKIFNAEIFHDL